MAQQFQTDIPLRPICRQFDIHCGICGDCGRAVHGRHELQTSDDEQVTLQGLALACYLEELTDGRFSYAPNRRLAKHLQKHIWQWFWFLIEPGIDATNWRAEQAIRPAVVNRKVWGGNRTWAGAQAQATIASVLRTCEERGRNSFRWLMRALCSTQPTPLPAGG